MQLEKLLDKIIEAELEMFELIKTAEPSSCKDHPETFRVMRRMTHSVLSIETLESYFKDLQQAKAEGKNLLTEKYARMDNLIPPLKTNPDIIKIINEIVETEADWMRDLSGRYPRTFKNESVSFKNYLSSELETYSDQTLRLYRRDVYKAQREERNLAEEAYTKLFQQIGYNSINGVEEKKKKNRGVSKTSF